MITTLPKTILFIPGAFIGYNCWDEWRIYFERKGYHTIAAAWPYKNATTEVLRNNDFENTIATVRLPQLLDHFATIVRLLPDTPILVGHSVGGLIVQLLLAQGLGVAGIALHSFPPRKTGRLSFSFIDKWWEPMGFFSRAKENYLVSFKKWGQSISNGMSMRLQIELYYRLAVPESKRLIRDLFTGNTRIDFKKPHAPLLLISGGEDRLIPSSVNYKNYSCYSRDHSITAYMDFPRHNHLIFTGPEWKEVADYMLSWLQQINC